MMAWNTRFNVLKRDKFTCQYCGRKAPEVELQVDHVIPIEEGGTKGPENLVTACRECNWGKGNELLTGPPNFGKPKWHNNVPYEMRPEYQKRLRERAKQSK